MNFSQPSSARRIADRLFGIYTWLTFLPCLTVAAILTLVLPGIERRRQWVTNCARFSFFLAGMTPTLRGLEKIPDNDCVVVANHASYLDGVILQAFLPPRFTYVIKGEVRHLRIAGFFLRRIGCRFVERFDQSGRTRDARDLLKAASAGESLAFFPEGTFVKEPGLGRFRAGAFVAARKATAPLVPVVISGSRYILPAGAVLPRHGPIRIDALNPIDNSEPAYENSASLAELSRQRILTVLDEPDLLSNPKGSEPVANPSALPLSTKD